MNNISRFRTECLVQICKYLLFVDKNGVPNWSDGDSPSSVSIGKELAQRMPEAPTPLRLPPQEIGSRFQEIIKRFVESAFSALQHVRPGTWLVETGGRISRYYQYEHLAHLDSLTRRYPELKATLGTEYLIKPDIVIARCSEQDSVLDPTGDLLSGDASSRLTPLRRVNYAGQILHAVISCKWTIRSDRAQNTRTEALNVVRNRKGHTPHIVAVTAEPLPTRIAALALGTGDIDCVYHIALPELEDAIAAVNNSDQADMLHTLIQGRRLRDLSDLPLDLVI
jgi:hypothetical protein